MNPGFDRNSSITSQNPSPALTLVLVLSDQLPNHRNKIVRNSHHRRRRAKTGFILRQRLILRLLIVMRKHLSPSTQAFPQLSHAR